MDEKEPLEPEIVEDPPKRQDLALKAQPEALAEISSQPAPFPFLNRFEKRRIESFTEVVKAETNLMTAVGEHARTKFKLKDIEIEIKTDRLERELKLKEKEREAKLQEKKDVIAELELEVQEAELREKLNKLKKTGGEEPEESKTERLKKDLKEKLETKKVYQDYDIEEAMLKFMKEFKTKQALKKVVNELKEEIEQNDNLKADEKGKILENLEDCYNQMLDRM